MAKDKEKNTARILYVEQGKTAKEIADLLAITEKTISVWVNKYGWKTAKNAKAISHQERLKNIYAIIEQLATDRIALSHETAQCADTEQVKDLRNRIAQIDSAVANWNKTLQNLSKQNNINQLVLINCMEIIFKHFDALHPDLLSVSIPFQEKMLTEIIPIYAKE